MDFFTLAAKDKNSEVKLNIAYNLPCFMQNYGKNLENLKIFEQIFSDFMQDTSANSSDI